MKCKFIKDNGERCEANTMKNSGYCYLHNPDVSKKDKEIAQSNGGKNRAVTIGKSLEPVSIKKTSDVVRLLEKTINDVRSGELDIRVANSIGYLSGHLIKALEVSEIEERVSIIERAVIERKTYK